MHVRSSVVSEALESAQRSWTHLVQMSARYVSGTLVGYEPLSRQAYVASCDLRTLSQSMDWAFMGEQEQVLRLNEAGQALFERAQENEKAHASGALARSGAYFDDLLDEDDLFPSGALADRLGPDAPVSEAHLN